MKLTKSFTHLWKYKPTHNVLLSIDKNWYFYLGFAFLRLILVFLPQIGYIHPDEFFQSVEVMTGDHFQLEHIRSWEFNNSMPVRSITLPFMMLRVPWSFYEFIAMQLKEFMDWQLLSSYSYLVFPRLLFCLMSFLNDWCMYRICRLYSLKADIRLLALSSSWVMLVFAQRTFSNTIEMVLCSLLLWLVAESMLVTNTVVYKRETLEDKYEQADSIGQKVKIWKLKNSLPAHNYQYLLLLSSVCVAGVFNRPTFLLFGAPMVFYWMLRGMGTRSITFKDFNLRMLLFVCCSLPALCFFIFCDSLYYKHLTVGELMMMKVGIENFVFTPWNFVRYNLDSNNTAEHGIHPKYVHLLANIPLLYNILGVVALVSFGQLSFRFFKAEYQGLPRAQSIVGLMSAAIFVPLFFLSLINHQEARFLIPLTFPIVLLHAPKLITGFCANYPFRDSHDLLKWLHKKFLCTAASAKIVYKIWFTSNLLLTVFFGFIHQAGVYPLSNHLKNTLTTKPTTHHWHLVSSHLYSMPMHFLNIKSSQQLLFDKSSGRSYRRQKDFYLYEYGSLDLNKLVGKLKLIASLCEIKKEQRKIPYRLLLALPNSLSDDLYDAFLQYPNASSYFSYELETTFYPHLSTEAFPKILGRHPCDIHAPHKEDDDLTGTCSLEQNPSLTVDYVSQQFSSFVHQFGLALYEFKVKSTKTKARSLTETNDPKKIIS